MSRLQVFLIALLALAVVQTTRPAAAQAECACKGSMYWMLHFSTSKGGVIERGNGARTLIMLPMHTVLASADQSVNFGGEPLGFVYMCFCINSDGVGLCTTKRGGSTEGGDTYTSDGLCSWASGSCVDSGCAANPPETTPDGN